MATREEYLPPLTWFFEEVDAKLNHPKNVVKNHWNEITDYGLMVALLRAEVAELEEALEWGQVNKAAIISECADVAAFAMMIADNINKDVHREDTTK